MTQDTNLVQTNDKINVIERKFNAFETKYMESQNTFIESFRNLDERHKVYMDNIQETIKEIVEKSLGHHENILTEQLSTPKGDHEYEEPVDTGNGDVLQSKPDNEQPLQLKLYSPDQIPSSNSLSQSEEEREDSKVICKVDVHTISGMDTNLQTQHDGELNFKRATAAQSNLFEEMALNEFEQRLNQLGVDADSAGLATPRSCEVHQDLADEREEMKKVRLVYIV